MRHDGKWLRREDGSIMIAKNRECEWTPHDDIVSDQRKEEHI